MDTHTTALPTRIYTNEGYSALEPYRVFITSTHHEYWSKEMWDGLDAFKKAGGRLMYMGANAWYWRVAYHQTRPGVLEVRRTEGGIRAWAAEPGEYYHSFTGEYGGLWRRSGRPPQMMAGTGFSAQGFDVCSYYKRAPGSRDARVKFIFEGVDDEIIGDFGLIGGGAAGLELDRADRSLGHSTQCSRSCFVGGALARLHGRLRGNLYQCARDVRRRTSLSPSRHGILRDSGRWRGLLDQFHLLVGQSFPQRLQKQRLENHGKCT